MFFVVASFKKKIEHFFFLNLCYYIIFGESFLCHQSVHFLFEIIFELGLHSNALLNSSKFANTPLTRKRPGAYPFVFNADSNELLFRISHSDCKQLKYHASCNTEYNSEIDKDYSRAINTTYIGIRHKK